MDLRQTKLSCGLLVFMGTLVCGSVLAQRGSNSAGSGSSGDAVPVSGYYRANGTYVQPSYRSAPDGNFYNNWSTSGNVNPYTGQAGTRTTPSYNSPSPSYLYTPSVFADPLETWIGLPKDRLLIQWGKPYKTHEQSIEYKKGNCRIEFFVDNTDRILRIKTWAYDGGIGTHWPDSY